MLDLPRARRVDDLEVEEERAEHLAAEAALRAQFADFLRRAAQPGVLGKKRIRALPRQVLELCDLLGPVRHDLVRSAHAVLERDRALVVGEGAGRQAA